MNNPSGEGGRQGAGRAVTTCTASAGRPGTTGGRPEEAGGGADGRITASAGRTPRQKAFARLLVEVEVHRTRASRRPRFMHRTGKRKSGGPGSRPRSWEVIDEEVRGLTGTRSIDGPCAAGPPSVNVRGGRCAPASPGATPRRRAGDRRRQVECSGPSRPPPGPPQVMYRGGDPSPLLDPYARDGRRPRTRPRGVARGARSSATASAAHVSLPLELGEFGRGSDAFGRRPGPRPDPGCPGSPRVGGAVRRLPSPPTSRHASRPPAARLAIPSREEWEETVRRRRR